MPDMGVNVIIFEIFCQTNWQRCILSNMRRESTAILSQKWILTLVFKKIAENNDHEHIDKWKGLYVRDSILTKKFCPKFRLRICD
jgi:hypothetical protein